MAKNENISIKPWSPLAGGSLSGKYKCNNEIAYDSRHDAFDFPPINKQKAYDLIDLMAEIGKNHRVSVANVALNWVVKQPGMTSTIIGAKNLQQLNDNISAINLQLTSDELQQLNDASALAPEYPGWQAVGRAK